MDQMLWVITEADGHLSSEREIQYIFHHDITLSKGHWWNFVYKVNVEEEGSHDKSRL